MGNGISTRTVPAAARLFRDCRGAYPLHRAVCPGTVMMGTAMRSGAAIVVHEGATSGGVGGTFGHHLGVKAGDQSAITPG
jgi:hypothetical protein